MSEEEPTPEVKKIMLEDANDLSNAIWDTLRTYNVENEGFVGKNDVILNSLTTVTANVLHQLGRREYMTEICTTYWYEVLMKLKSLMYKDDGDGEQTRSTDQDRAG